MTDTEIQIKALVGEIHNLKRDFAFKLEEIQALYLENKKHREMSEKFELENKHLKQQIKNLEAEQEDLLNYP